MTLTSLGAQTVRRVGAGPVGGLLGGKDPTGRARPRLSKLRAITTSLLDLSRVLEPLQVVGRLLPPLVGRSGADQFHVGPQVLAVLPGPVAGAVGAKAEILGRELLRRFHQLGE